MGWIGNIFLIIGVWLIGEKKRVAFIFTIVGELFWGYYSIDKKMYDLIFICLLFAVLAFINWLKWGKENPYWERLVQDEKRRSGKLSWKPY